QRGFARRGTHEVLTERLQDGLEGEQILRPVVDEQNVDGQLFHACHRRAPRAAGGLRAVRASAIPWSVRARASGTTRSAAAGFAGLPAAAGGWTSASPPRSTMRRSPREPSALAPVSTTPTARSP